MTLHSNYSSLCPVQLPFDWRQRYMHAFDLGAPKMADGFEDYLEPVTALCKAANATRGTAYMTVDEKLVGMGQSQRRPRPHVDGCFVPALNKWHHEPSPQWVHGIKRMAVIVASSAAGCRAWRGEFEGEPKDDGDLSHIAAQLDAGEVLSSNVGYLLSPDCVHESMVFNQPTRRTFLRIALPVELAA